MPGPTRNTGYLQNIVQYDASNNVILPSLTGTGSRMVISSSTGVLSAQDIPTLSALGGVPTSRTLTIDGVSYDLSANRTWTILPTGGAAGQLLAKSSATNYATEWIDNYTSEVKHYVKLAENMSIGTAVYVSGSTGQAGTNMLVSKASNASEGTSSKTLGLVAFTGVTNDIGFVVTEGLLEGLDTSAAGAAGDPVWLGVNGALIFGLANKPIAPAHLVFIGVVTRKQQNNGEIFVKVQNGFEFGELHDYVQTGVLDNYVISYESSTSLYKPKSIATLLGYTPANAARTITINGTSYDLSADRSWTINSMIYPGAGIAVSTGTAWGTSLTDNSSNWNTAYSWGNHASAGYATQTYVGTQIANLVASSPATLDTLNELAAALGNDAAFSTTVSTALGNRLRVDINTQGLSATLQGYGRTNLGLGTAATSNTGDFAAASHTHSIANVTGLQTALDGKQASGSYAASVHTHIISDVTGLQTALDGKQASLGFTPYNSTNPSGYISSYTETDTLASVTSRGASTSNPIYVDTTTGGGYVFRTSNSWGGWARNAFTISDGSSNLLVTLGGYGGSGTSLSYAYIGLAYNNNWITFSSSAVNSQVALQQGGNQVWHAGNLTNLNQLTNGPGYITSAGNAATATNVAYSGLTGTVPTWNQNTTGTAANSTLWNGAGYSYTATSTVNSYILGLSANGDWRPMTTAAIQSWLGLGSLAYSSATIPTNNNQLTNGAGYITSDSTKLPLAGGTMTGQLTIDGLNFSGNTDSLYITNKRGSYYPLRILNSQGDYRGVLIEHVDGTGSGGPGPDGSFGFKFEDKRGSNYSGDHKASFIVKRSGAFGVTNIFEVISTSNTSLAVTTGGKVVVNSTSNIATGALSIVSGGSAGVGWGSGLNIGDSSNYMGFIQDVGTSRFRNHGNGVFEFFNSGGDTNFAISSLGNLSIRGNALGGGFVNLLSASKQNYYTFTGYPNQNVGGVPKNVCDEVNSAGLSWTSYGYQTSADGAGLAYIKVDLNAAHIVTHFAVFGYTGGSHKPTGNWNLLGSNDDVNWTTVGTANAAQWMADNNGTYPFRPHAIVKCSNPGSYRYYRVQAYGWTNNYLLIHNWGLFTGGAMTDIYNDGVTTGGAVYAGGDVTAYSDISVKENIRPIINSLEKITKSRGVLYDRIDSGAKNNIGFIAQELEINFPELIHTNDDGTKGVKYQNATAILFEAIKEQQTQIESQKSEIDELKDLVKQLINR
jgi:hypothetical protein